MSGKPTLLYMPPNFLNGFPLDNQSVCNVTSKATTNYVAIHSVTIWLQVEIEAQC